MTRRRGITGPPASYLAQGTWPSGRLRRDAPPAARYAQHVSNRLAVELAGVNLSELCRRVDLNRSTIQRWLAGASWPDFVSLAKLEHELGVRLWPE